MEVLAGMSVATSLAVELAESLNMTLIGGLRKDRFNIYCGFKRLLEFQGLGADMHSITSEEGHLHIVQSSCSK